MAKETVELETDPVYKYIREEIMEAARPIARFGIDPTGLKSHDLEKLGGNDDEELARVLSKRVEVVDRHYAQSSANLEQSTSEELIGEAALVTIARTEAVKQEHPRLKGRLEKFEGKVLDAAGNFLARVGGKKSLAAVSELSLLITASRVSIAPNLVSLPAAENAAESERYIPPASPAQPNVPGENPIQPLAEIDLNVNLAESAKLVEKDESVEGALIPNNLPVVLVPIYSDFFYNQKAPIETFSLGAGDDVLVDYKGLWTIETAPGQAIRVTTLPHTTGGMNYPLAIFDKGTLDSSGKYTPTETYYQTALAKGSDYYSSFTYTAENEIYPNKIDNILEALTALAEYQDQNGAFKAGVVNSYLNILDVPGRDYVLGKNSAGYLVRAGGICATASTLAKSLFLGGATFAERWMHPSDHVYPVSPGDPLITAADSDATVGFDKEGFFDFKWVQPKDGYLSVQAAVLPDYFNKQGGNYDPPDARIVFSIIYTPNKPQGEAEKLKAIKDAYDVYRKSGREERLDALTSGGTLTGKFDWGKSGAEEIIKIVYPEAEVTDFQNELESDPYLSDIVEVGNDIEQYKSLYTSADVVAGKAPRVGAYLKTTPWYQAKKSSSTTQEMAKIDSALTGLDRMTYYLPDQAIQCVGWVDFLAALGYGDSPRDAGGDVRRASDLVPLEVRSEPAGYKITKGYNGFLYTTGTGVTIDDVKVGDLFVRYDTPAGHIGAVVAEKTVNGEKVLLVSDANRENDGRVRIFEVTNQNFNPIFGQPPYIIVLIR